MKLYVYDKITKELIGDIDGLIDPLESELQGRNIYVIPPFTTPVIPEKFEEGKVNVYNEEKKLWELVSDFRGTIVFDKKGNVKEIIELGDIPEGYLLEKPYNLQEAKLEKIREVEIRYAEAQAEKVKLGKLTARIADIGVLNNALETSTKETFVTVNLDEPVILEVSKLEEERRLLYVRSLLLPIRRKELLASIKSVRNKAQLDKFVISFNIDKEIKEKAKLSEEDFNNYIRENL